MGVIDSRLATLGITLPEATVPVANYVPCVKSGKLLFFSGQIPLVSGRPMAVGQVGLGISLEQAQACARLCGLNLLVHLKAACGGNLDLVARIVKLVCFVNAAQDFAELPKVANAASDLMVEVFGEHGRHARSTVGVSNLPLNVPVEVEAVVELL